MGCSLGLRIHGTRDQAYRAAHLTINGPSRWVYALCFEQAVSLRFDLSWVGLSSSQVFFQSEVLTLGPNSKPITTTLE